MREEPRQPLLTSASARDEAAYVLFVANNARAHSARVRIVTALVWAVSVAQFVPNFWREPVHLLRFALVTTAYTVVVFDQLRVAVHLFQAKQASIRSLVQQERTMLRSALLAAHCCIVVIVLLQTEEAGIVGPLVSVLITNYLNLLDQVRVVEAVKSLGLMYLVFIFQAASVTLFKPRLRTTAGQALLGSPGGAFAVDLAVGVLVAFLGPLCIATIWEARMRAYFLSTHGRPHACLGPFWAWLAGAAYPGDRLTWQPA